MTRAYVLAAVILCSACTGSTGEQGPAGPAGPPYKRAASYCNATSTNAGPANSWTLSATCTAVADIAIEGWCFEPQGLPSGAFRASDGPVDWADTTKAAGWACSWSWQGGATQTPFPATVEICCATPQ